jgi:type IV secretory pathway VirB3-like protein
MGDGDSTTKARFEPPPWEQEAFEALAARRAEEQAVREVLAAAAAATAAATLAVSAPVIVPPVVSEPAVVPVAPAVEKSDAPAKPTVDEGAVQAMLIQLQSEERTDTRAAKRVGLVASALTLALGSGMLIAGVSMMRGGAGKQVAVIGSLVLSVFGLAFIAMAVWVWITTSSSTTRSFRSTSRRSSRTRSSSTRCRSSWRARFRMCATD